MLLMEIKTGQYTIHSDKCCMWITEETTAKVKKDGSGGKVKIEKVAGYSGNFRQLLESFIGHKTRCMDAKSVKEVLEAFAKIEIAFQAVIDAVDPHALRRESGKNDEEDTDETQDVL